MYSIIYHCDNITKKTRKKQPINNFCEIKFSLEDLNKETKAKFIELFPNYENINQIKLKYANSIDEYDTNFIKKSLDKISDITEYYGIFLDTECIITNQGNSYINEDLSLSINRAVLEETKLELCLNTEFIDYINIIETESVDIIIERLYDVYSELIIYLREKFEKLLLRKQELECEYKELFQIEYNRIN